MTSDETAGRAPRTPESAGYCAEPECIGQATHGDLCGFHAEDERYESSEPIGECDDCGANLYDELDELTGRCDRCDWLVAASPTHPAPEAKL